LGRTVVTAPKLHELCHTYVDLLAADVKRRRLAAHALNVAA
jgi:hypothetical protein